MTRQSPRYAEDSDSDSEDEIQIKRYLNPGIKDGVIQPRAFQECLQSARALQDLHVGVKRQSGHYHVGRPGVSSSVLYYFKKIVIQNII